MKAFEFTASEIAKRVQNKELDPEVVAKFYIERTNKLSGLLNSHTDFDEKFVEKQVFEIKRRVKAGEALPLAGVPVAVKDNICTKELKTTCGSKILEGYKSPYDATVVEKLKAAGAVIFSKANCDEFAMGSSNETSAYGPVKNPWNLEYVPGGSSGGSAAVVAADLVPLSLGSDTGGSIRQPASFTGIVGLKPTYGRVSRYGLVSYASSLDQIGPMGRTVGDVALAYSVIKGEDPRDATSVAVSGQIAKPGPFRIGVVRNFLGEGVTDEVVQSFSEVCEVFRKTGSILEEVTLESLDLSLAAYYIIATAEASSNLARYDGVRYGVRHAKKDASLNSIYSDTRDYGFGTEVKKRILLGTFALSAGYYDAYYGKASKVRSLITNDFTQSFKKYDLLIGPTSPITAFKIGAKISDPLAMYKSDICTIAVNLAGLPAISVPSGFDKNGLPMGLQIIAAKYDEETLLKGAFLYEQATNWNNTRRPGGV